MNLDISKIASYARKIGRGWGYERRFLEDCTLDELNDYFEANPQLLKKPVR